MLTLLRAGYLRVKGTKTEIGLRRLVEFTTPVPFASPVPSIGRGSRLKRANERRHNKHTGGEVESEAAT
eukprot:7114702-Pyramimonas_sp.AAC.1